MTNEEQNLLAKLASGALDGLVGNDKHTSGGSRIWMDIKDGVPGSFKQGPGTKFFDGKENEYVPGVLHVLQKWLTDEDKLQFLQKFGWLLKDEEAKAYSKKFKP